jgi:kynurenine formamidase
MVKIGQISMGMPSGTIIQAPLYFVKGHIPDKKKN